MEGELVVEVGPSDADEQMISANHGCGRGREKKLKESKYIRLRQT